MSEVEAGRGSALLALCLVGGAEFCPDEVVRALTSQAKAVVIELHRLPLREAPRSANPREEPVEAHLHSQRWHNALRPLREDEEHSRDEDRIRTRACGRGDEEERIQRT